MKRKAKDIGRIFREGTPIDRAIERAAVRAIRAHEKAGLPVVVWKNGRPALVSAKDLLRKKAR